MMTKWLVTVEHMHSHRKTNMVVSTAEDLPTVEEIQKIIEQANSNHNPLDNMWVAAHIITFMQRLKGD